MIDPDAFLRLYYRVKYANNALVLPVEFYPKIVAELESN